MGYIRTKLGTGWREREPGVLGKLLRILFRDPNPDYRMYLVRSWLVEFDECGGPAREVGVGANGEPVLVGPDHRNYGFWLDTNMTWRDFTGDEISQEDFEAQWSRWSARSAPEST